MAEKTLKTRIINKHADLAEWKDSELLLKAGEIALAKVNTTKPDGHGGFYTVPTYLMKVGVGDKKFSELQWLAAPASDVYEWAKKSSMSATDIPVFTADDAARIIPTFSNDITNLKNAIGSGGSVSEMIQTAIEALDVTDTEVGDTENAYQVVTAVSEADGKISVTRRALAIKDITGLQSAIDLKLDISTYNAVIGDDNSGLVKDVNDLKANSATKSELELAVSGLQGNIDLKADLTALNSTNEAVADAQDAADAAQGDATAALNAIGDFDSDKTIAAELIRIEAAVSTEAEAREAADNGLDGRIGVLEGKITGLSGAMHFKGVLSAIPEDYTDYVDGDVIIVGNKEYVYYSESESDVKFVEFGDVDDVSGRVTDLENNSATKSELELAESGLQGKIDLKADLTALNSTNEAVAAAQGAANAAQGDATAALIAIGDDESGLVKEVNDLKANSATKSELELAESGLQGKIDLKADLDALNSTNEAVAAAQDAADAAQGDATAALNAIGTGYTTGSTIADDIGGVKARIAAIEEDYLTAADTYIFDCGGAVDDGGADDDGGAEEV